MSEEKYTWSFLLLMPQQPQNARYESPKYLHRARYHEFTELPFLHLVEHRPQRPQTNTSIIPVAAASRVLPSPHWKCYGCAWKLAPGPTIPLGYPSTSILRIPGDPWQYRISSKLAIVKERVKAKLGVSICSYYLEIFLRNQVES